MWKGLIGKMSVGKVSGKRCRRGEVSKKKVSRGKCSGGSVREVISWEGNVKGKCFEGEVYKANELR